MKKRGKLVLSAFLIFLILLMSLNFAFSSTSTNQTSDLDIIKKCPQDFEGYKEEYGISQQTFKELFEVCHSPILNEQEDFKRGKLKLRPKDIEFNLIIIPENYPSVKLNKHEIPISKEEAKQFLKDNKNTIKWINKAKLWKNKLDKNIMPEQNTVAYYIKKHKLSVIKRLEEENIL